MYRFQLEVDTNYHVQPYIRTVLKANSVIHDQCDSLKFCKHAYKLAIYYKNVKATGCN